MQVICGCVLVQRAPGQAPTLLGTFPPNLASCGQGSQNAFVLAPARLNEKENLLKINKNQEQSSPQVQYNLAFFSQFISISIVAAFYVDSALFPGPGFIFVAATLPFPGSPGSLWLFLLPLCWMLSFLLPHVHGSPSALSTDPYLSRDIHSCLGGSPMVASIQDGS